MFRVKDVVRVAVAAVENGEDACQLARAVKEAVKCPGECAAQLDDFDNGVQAAEEDLKRVEDAIVALLSALGLPATAPPGDEKTEPEKLIPRLLRLIRNLSLIYDLGLAIAELIAAVSALAFTVRGLIASARNLVDCLAGSKS